METSILDMPFHAALEIMKEWVREEHDGELKLDDPMDCPVQQWIMHNDKGCGKDLGAGIETCQICGGYVCPTCKNHKCIPESRITGYIGDVNGWNNSKKEELKDRYRTDVATFS